MFPKCTYFIFVFQHSVQRNVWASMAMVSSQTPSFCSSSSPQTSKLPDWRTGLSSFTTKHYPEYFGTRYIHICPNCQMYLLRLKKVFVHVARLVRTGLSSFAAKHQKKLYGAQDALHSQKFKENC